MFGLRPVISSHIYITLADVKEAYEIARVNPCPKEREAFYACLGMDIQQVERLLPSIIILEKAWEMEKTAAKKQKNGWEPEACNWD